MNTALKEKPKGNGAVKALLLGVLLSAAVAALLGYRFTAAAVAAQKAELGNRQAGISAMALADLVGAAVETDGVSVQDLVTEWDQKSDNVSDIRILRIGGARLLASTMQADLDREGIGKRLPREDKTFFDEAKAIQSGRKTNIREETFRKEEILYTQLENGDFQVTVPYFSGDDIKGAVRMSVTPSLKTESVSMTPALLLFLLPLLLVGALAFVLKNQNRWVQTGVALAVLFGALAWFNSGAIGGLAESRTGYEGQLAEYFGAVRGLTADKVALVPSFTPATENIWDTDEFRRPLNLFNVQGVVNTDAVERAVETPAGLLRNALWLTSVFAMVILVFFGSGWASRFWETLVEYREAYAYISPAFLGMVLLVFFPFAYGIALSFTGQTLYNTDKALWDIWVGLDNYIRVLGDFAIVTSGEDGSTQTNYANFYWTLFITVMWTVCNVTIGVSVGLMLALCLNTKGLRLKPLYRAILILPWAIPTYVTALIWKGLFHNQFGPINYMIVFFGGEKISWFDSVFTSFLTGIAVNGWLSFPFMMVISLGGLQSISQDMYEAAKLDGASKVQQFFYITLPSLKPTLIPAVIISVVWTFNLFNVIYLVSAGEPGGANEILVTKAYKIAFQDYQYGYAAAYSTVIFMILCAYGLFQNKVSKATEDIAA